MRELSPVLLAAGSRARARGTATAPRASHSSPGLPHPSDDDQETTRRRQMSPHAAGRFSYYGN